MLRVSYLLLVVVSLAACARAQPVTGSDTPHAAALAPELAPLEGLLGYWEGPATAMTQTGPVEMWQTEAVRTELGGALIVVEGTGRRMGGDGDPGEILFHAFGVFSVDAATGEIWLDTFTREGQHVRVQPVPVEDGFNWGFDVSEGGPVVAYEMRFDEAGRWTETGQVSLPNGQTLDTFEMTLDRVEPED